MRNVKELLDEAIYAGNLSENEEEKLYSWIESLILAKRKADEYEAKAVAFDVIKEYITDELRDMRRVTEDVPFAFAEELEALEDVLDKMTEYESGESDA